MRARKKLLVVEGKKYTYVNGVRGDNLNITSMHDLIESLPEMETLSSLLQNRAKYITREFTIEGMQLQASVIKEDKIQTSNISDTTHQTAMNYEKEHKAILRDINNVQKKIGDIKTLLGWLLDCERFIIQRSVIDKIKEEKVYKEYIEKFGKERLPLDSKNKPIWSLRSYRRFKRSILHKLIRRYEK